LLAKKAVRDQRIKSLKESLGLVPKDELPGL
jgi:hypothetical protein